MTLREVLRDDRGFTLPELMFGIVISSLIMVGVASTLWVANRVQTTAGDEAAVAGYLATLGIRLDRDLALADVNAAAKTQVTETNCSNTMNLGSVSYQLVARSEDGPNWLMRTDSQGAFPLAKLVTQCTWQVLTDSVTINGTTTDGRPYVQMNITLEGVRHTQISQILKGAPRLW